MNRKKISIVFKINSVTLVLNSQAEIEAYSGDARIKFKIKLDQIDSYLVGSDIDVVVNP